ncbi:MAG: COX15/CtaA family protein [Gemmataceae bacterium]
MAVASSTFDTAGDRSSAVPRWLHACAVFTVIAAFPLLFLGAEVTTHQLGMVDQVGMRTPWHLWEVASEKIEEGNWGFLIEHSHRTFGWLVGASSIILAVGLYLTQKKHGLRWLGIACLSAVTIQGLLGKYRVDAFRLVGPDFANELALVHGCFAQLVFALLVSAAYLTGQSSSGRGLHVEPAGQRKATGFRKLALFTAALIYGQVVLGAITRHSSAAWGPRLHLLTAFVVVGMVVTLWLKQSADGRLTTALRVMTLLVGMQLILGLEAWITKFATPSVVQLRPLVSNATFRDLPRSLHALTGALLFASSMVVVLQAWLPVSEKIGSVASLRRLKGSL